MDGNSFLLFVLCMVFNKVETLEIQDILRNFLGLGNAWFFQARDYYFKDYMDLEPAEAQANTAAAHTPWNSESQLFPTCLIYDLLFFLFTS